MKKILATAILGLVLVTGTVFAETDPYLVTPCVGVGNFTIGMTEQALLRVAEKGSLKDNGKEVVKEFEKTKGTMREEIRIRMEKFQREVRNGALLSGGNKSYTYRYPGTKIELDFDFSDYRLEAIHFFSPKFHTKEGVTTANFLHKENTKYIVSVDTSSNGSLSAYYSPGSFSGLSFHTRGRKSGLILR
jgi:hypothetical protein